MESRVCRVTPLSQEIQSPSCLTRILPSDVTGFFASKIPVAFGSFSPRLSHLPNSRMEEGMGESATSPCATELSGNPTQHSACVSVECHTKLEGKMGNVVL